VSCEYARRWFSDSFDGQPLPAWARFVVWFHLHRCPRCRRVASSLRATEDALAALKDEPPPESTGGSSGL